MQLSISLFGKRSCILGWMAILDQEKIPFKYCGVFLSNFSTVNILVGYLPQQLPQKDFNSDRRIFLIEPRLYKNKQKEIHKRDKLHILHKKNLIIFTENVSARLSQLKNSDGEMKQKLKDILILAFQRLHLPYIHIWYYPFPSKTIFLFRQDVDYIDRRGIKSLINVTSKYGIRGTYFINVSGEEEFDEKIGPLKLPKPTTPDRKDILFDLLKMNNEIANHGYWHWVFTDYKNNLKNIRIAQQFFTSELRVTPDGFASPGGAFNKNLLKAIEKSCFLYSSNGLHNGGFPFYPIIDGRKSQTLEIPFYFLCDASIERRNFLAFWRVLRDYYMILIRESQVSHIPIAILGHPDITGRSATYFYKPIFRAITADKIPTMTAVEFAQWWKKRTKMKISSNLSKNNVCVKSPYGNFFVQIHYRGKEKIFHMQNNKLTISLQDVLKWGNEYKNLASKAKTNVGMARI